MALEKTRAIYDKLVKVSETVDAMKSELQPSIDALDTQKREKTSLTEAVKNTLLDEIPRPAVGDYFDGKISAYFDQEFSVTDESVAIRQIIQYANTYKDITGVDIVAALLSVKIGGVKDRVLAAPREFGLVAQTDEDGVVSWQSRGMTIDMVKKVRVAREL